MALQLCASDGTPYAGVTAAGTAAVCPSCGSDQYHPEGLEPKGWKPKKRPAAEPLADAEPAEPGVGAETGQEPGGP